jgi:hypothetical protein
MRRLSDRGLRREGGRGLAGEGLLLTVLAIGVLAAYLAIQRGRIVSWDGRSMASVGQSLYRHGSVAQCCHAFRAFPADHLKYSKFGIGLSLLLAPLWGPQLHTHPNGAIWLGLANPCLLVATTLVIAKTALTLGWRRSTAVPVALAFALLTMAPNYSTEFFAEPGVAFGTALAVWGYVVWSEHATRGALLVGVGVAVAVLFRADSMMLVAPIVPMLALTGRVRERIPIWRRWLFALGVPIAAAIGWTLAYDQLRFGSPLSFGYNGVYDRLGFSTPLLHGLDLLLLSPGKSLFIYAPVLLAALPGLWFLARTHRALTITIVALCIVRLCFVARWWTPEGGSAWGPRFLFPMCVLLAIPLGAAVEHLHVMRPRTRVIGSAGLGVLAAAGLVVQFASVAVPYDAVFNAIGFAHELPVPHRIHAERYHEYLWGLGHNHIVWNFEHLASAHWAALYWFRNGPTVFGVVMLLVAVAGCAAAVTLACVPGGEQAVAAVPIPIPIPTSDYEETLVSGTVAIANEKTVVV